MTSTENGAPADRAGRAKATESPWATAMRRLKRDKPAMAALCVLILIGTLCLMAPSYARHIAHADPFVTNLNGTVEIDGQIRQVLEPSTTGLGLGLTPIGPTWTIGPYFLGADNQGRDVAARLLYGGRNSLFIALTSTLLCVFLATLVGTMAGFFGGFADTVLSRILDVLWAFPIFLLAISLSIVLLNQTLTIGPWDITSGSLALPIFIIGIVYVPYVARPIRSHVQTLMVTEFVTAAIGLGASPWRVLFKDILPNVVPRVVVFIPLILALSMSIESALSFLSIGVQPPDASWGTIIQDGQGLLYSRPIVALAPGIAIALTVLALNILGDGVRDALDPKSSVRIL